jgi:lipoprotein-releasing system ATP-binding protein
MNSQTKDTELAAGKGKGSDCILQAKDLHRVYTDGDRKLHILRGIDMEVKPGEIVTITGASGSGKSTLLHLLGGLDVPTQGSVFIDGMDLYGMTDEQRAGLRNKKIGFVFQFYHLLSEFTALENVMLPAMIMNSGLRNGMDARRSLEHLRERGINVLAEVALGDRINHRPAELSGGEQQRVAIARALINQPDIVLCDEPTGNLDAETNQEIVRLLVRLNEVNTQTFVIVTHEMEIARVGQKMFRLKNGVLE